ncbi:MAG: ester cyclase [Acidimicrobiia bacterium]
MAGATDLATAIIEAFNDADWDRMRSVCSPDIVYQETGTGRDIQGVEDYLDLARTWRQGFPDVTGKINTALADGGTVALDITWTGTNTGPLITPAGEIPATGKPMQVVSTVWFQVAGDRVEEVRNHLDLAGMLGQLGLLPG